MTFSFRPSPVAVLCIRQLSYRCFLNAVTVFALIAGAFNPLRADTSSLTDLDFSKLQIAGKTSSSAEASSTGGGAKIPAHGSLWVDLHGTAEDFSAVVTAAPDQKQGVVRIRFSCANAVREVFVYSKEKPQRVHMSLHGESLLVIESLGVKNEKDLDVLITSSAITSNAVHPSTWGGEGPLVWRTNDWIVGIDGRSGGIVRIQHPTDLTRMQWIRPGTSWGTGWIKRDGQKTVWDRPTMMRSTGENRVEVSYAAAGVRVAVTRQLLSDLRIQEKYTFENTTAAPISLGDDGIGIRLPLTDSYPGADVCLAERCHVHLWMGGRSAYVAALRMGGAAPHLGMVLTEGSLTKYSIDDRIEHSNDRGQFIVHCPAMTLKPGESFSVGWMIFWHRGWSDFFAQAETIPGFVKLTAPAYAVFQGQPLQIEAVGDVTNAKLRINGAAQETGVSEHARFLNVPTRSPGEKLVELETASGTTWLRAYTAPEPWSLIEARVRFIIEHQQRHAPGDKLDGAFLIYDNETHQQFYDRDFPDHDAGRERLAMGTLLALYAKRCEDPALKKELEKSLLAYAAFVERGLQGESGFVYDDAGRSGPLRMYNFPWVAQFYLAMNAAYPKPAYLRHALDACRAYYNHGGSHFYCIGMPARWMAESLRQAGWENERTEMIAAFRLHANNQLKIGTHFPPQEVNYEQSIVGPAAQLMLEVYSITGEERFLEGAKVQLKLLELFGGQQPDYHFHDIAIRHWDDYWFGKRQMYGDTFPHYWSTITACAFNLYADAIHDSDYRTRGEGIFATNFCLFKPDGSASCAYFYPFNVNGKPGAFFDPWANDQDWALVNWMLFSSTAKHGFTAGVATADNF